MNAVFSGKGNIKVLLVSVTSKAAEFFADLSEEARLSEIVCVETAGQAKRKLVDNNFDILIINTPLTDDYGIQLALDVAESGGTGVLLIVRADMYEQVTCKVEEYGVLTLPRPISRQVAFQTIKLLIATAQKLKKYCQKAMSLEEKMEEIRLVNRAKWILIEQHKMNEAEAHRYIEKRAMDFCQKKKEIAISIIKTYEN